MAYWSDPSAGSEFWGRSDTSAITQPPMFGHTLATIVRNDVRPGEFGLDPAELTGRVVAGLMHLLRDRKRSPSGLVCVFHPWESGCDDSPRWPGADTSADDWLAHGRARWKQRKSDLVSELEFDGATPVRSRGFEVGSVGFSSLVAWNALEVAGALAGSHPMAEVLGVEGDKLANAIAERWRSDRRTWVDDPVVVTGVSDADVTRAASVRTSDALLALLIDPRPEGFSQLNDPSGFGGTFGPCGVHRSERSHDPDTYWRGSAWPQMSYLLLQAARQSDHRELADDLAASLVGGSVASDLAEYWNPDTGRGGGATPQTWAGLALLAKSVSS